MCSSPTRSSAAMRTSRRSRSGRRRPSSTGGWCAGPSKRRNGSGGPRGGQVGLELPAELRWLEWVVGSDWPAGDEDALWRLRDAWQAAAQDVQTVLADGNSASYRVLGAVGGAAAETFSAYW